MQRNRAAAQANRLEISSVGGSYRQADVRAGSSRRGPEARKSGWGGRVRTSEWRNQNPLPYHLATPQQGLEALGGRPRETRRNIPASPLWRNRAPAGWNPRKRAATGPRSRLRPQVLAAITPPRIAARSVAQSGSAPRSGRGGRRFKSCHSDHSAMTIKAPGADCAGAFVLSGASGKWPGAAYQPSRPPRKSSHEPMAPPPPGEQA